MSYRYAPPPVVYAAGAAIATFVAGPVFVLTAYASSDASGEDLMDSFAGFLMVTLFAIPIGALISILPNVAGAAVLAHAGCKLRTLRNWLIWLAAGAWFGVGLGYLLDYWMGAPLSYAVTGGCCAFVSHRCTRWTDRPARRAG